MKDFFTSRYALWLALPVGAALALAFAPFSWWPVAIVSPAFLFVAWHFAQSPRRAAKLGFLFTSGTYLAGTYWLYNSIHGIGQAPIPLTLLVMFLLVAIMGGYMAFVGYALARWLPCESPARRNLPLAAGARYLLVLPAAWVTLEWFRGWFLSGFPWLAIGYSHIDTPLAGLAPVGGIYTVSLAVVMCAGALSAAMLGDLRTRVAAACMFAALWIIGFSLWHRDWTATSGEPVSVAIVQGAVPQEMKWNEAQFQKTLQLYRDLTQPHLGAKVIVWPESALAAPVHMLGDFLGPMWVSAKQKGSSLVIGQLRRDPQRDVYYNAILALGAADEPQWYAKRRLVPLSEFFPVPAFVRDWLKVMDLPYSGFEPGADSQPALNAGGEKIGATICYEDAYASEQLEVLKEATLLVNVTNDAWFGDSTAAPQHLEISRMRALEAGRPLLRAANDGISAIIGHHGRIEHSLPRFQPGVVAASVQPRTGLSPYARIGNVPLVVLCFAILTASWLLLRRKRA